MLRTKYCGLSATARGKAPGSRSASDWTLGVAYVGNVGSGEVKDFTALGDAVNIAARLQAHAESGQIVMSEWVYESHPDRHAEAPLVQLDLKGKAAPVRARVIDLTNRRRN